MRRVYLIVAHGEQVIPAQAFASRRIAELARQALPIPAAYYIQPVTVRGSVKRGAVLWHLERAWLQRVRPHA